jgi:drug/metabolite transporter (DMT)-like permease
MKILDRFPATLLLVLCAVFWSLGGLFIKKVDLHPLTVAGLRSFFSLFILFFLFKPSIKSLRNFATLTAVICYAGTVICFSIATKWTTAANAILLQSTAPLFVAPLGLLYLNERIEKADIFSGIGILLGLFFFFRSGFESSLNTGDLFGLIAGFFFALFIVGTRKIGKTGAENSVFWGNVLTFLLSSPTLFPRQSVDSFWNLFAVNAPSSTHASVNLDTSFSSHLPTGQEWVYLIILGVVQLGLPYFLYTQAISKVTALRANIILLIEPILNPIWVFLFIHETPTTDTLIGGLLVLGAVTLRILFK